MLGFLSSDYFFPIAGDICSFLDLLVCMGLVQDDPAGHGTGHPAQDDHEADAPSILLGTLQRTNNNNQDDKCTSEFSI